MYYLSKSPVDDANAKSDIEKDLLGVPCREIYRGGPLSIGVRYKVNIDTELTIGYGRLLLETIPYNENPKFQIDPSEQMTTSHVEAAKQIMLYQRFWRLYRTAANCLLKIKRLG